MRVGGMLQAPSTFMRMSMDGFPADDECVACPGNAHAVGTDRSQATR